MADPSLPDEGRLEISVFDETEGKPIENAEIKVMKHGDHLHILDNEVTGQSGESGIINLAAPDISLSMNAENEEERPYSEYDIIVSSPGRRDVLIEGVQILPHATARQNVFMHSTDTRYISRNYYHSRQYTLGAFSSKSI